ncbi:MAG: phospholipase D family protein [Alphaproteobacteria bacterium]
MSATIYRLASYGIRNSSAVLFAILLACATTAFANDSEVCFTPGEDCTGIIVAVIGNAQQQILVQAYSFTSAPIAQALVAAQNRGVDVKAILDKSQRTERYSSARFLVNAGISTWIDDKVAIAHNKVMIVDDTIVITGSFNFTKSAQDRNAENLLVLHDAGLASKYKENWEARRDKSVRYLPN